MSNNRPDIHVYLKLLGTVPEIFRYSWDAIAIYDLEGRVVHGNAAARALIGGDRAEALRGNHFAAHITLEASTQAARDAARCIALGRTVDSHSVFVDGSEQAVPVRTRLVPARVDGTIVGVIGFARDERPQRDVEEQFMRSERQFQSLFENHPDALTLHDLGGRFLRVNAAFERLSGYGAEEIIGQTAAILLPEGRHEPDGILPVLQRGETTEFERQIRTKNGSVREVDGRRVPLLVEGTVRGYCVMCRDVTEERRAARSAARQATRIAELYRIASAAGVSSEDKISAALEAGLYEFGAERAYVAHAGDDTFVVSQQLVRTGAETAPEADLQDGIRDILARFKKDDAVVSPSFAAATLFVDERPHGVLAFTEPAGGMQISPSDRDYVRALAGLIGSAIQQGEREKRLDTLAFGDALTGLPNRTLLHDRLEQTLLSARRHRRSFAAHYIDVDHFKTINDTFGHDTGDGVLVAVGTWLRTVLRDSDTIGRMGGDEFVVLQPEIDSQRQAEELAAKLCTIRDQVFTVSGREIRVTVSVGCAVFPIDAESPVDMLKAADAALYDVKHRGRDGYAIGMVK